MKKKKVVVKSLKWEINVMLYKIIINHVLGSQDVT